MFCGTYRNKKLLRVPLLDKPKEGPARSGFFEKDQFSAVRRHLPDDLQVAVSIAYTYGWRMQSEVLADATLEKLGRPRARRRRPGDVPPRPVARRRAQHGGGGRERARCDGDQRPQDPERVRPLQHRERDGPGRGGAENGLGSVLGS